MKVLETERLRVRRLSPGDAGFVLRLLNEPSFLENIGDRGVRTRQDAEEYIRSGPPGTHARLGFGLDLVELKDSRAPIGICGLLKRDHLEHPDLGYALLPEFWGHGYAAEAAAGVVAHARDVLQIRTLLAVTSPGNESSARVLERAGFSSQGLARWNPDGEEVRLFRIELGAPREPSRPVASPGTAFS
jgi:ribosomal-protein-alanine N-acetyltransferase